MYVKSGMGRNGLLNTYRKIKSELNIANRRKSPTLAAALAAFGCAHGGKLTQQLEAEESQEHE
jgi:hypothetical protein